MNARDRSPELGSPRAPYYRERSSTPVPVRYDPSEYWEGLIDVPTYSWLYTFDQVRHESPSRRISDVKKRIGFTEECQKRAKGIVYMYACCRQLKLSRSVALTASYYFHRFYMRRDFAYYHYFEVAATSLFIACKAEECRRKLADVVKVCASMALQGRMSEKIDEDSSIYWKWKDVITNLEELLLEVLCFDVTPENPYKICLKTLGLEFDEDVTTTGTQDKEKAQRLFLQCTNFYELLSRLPLVLMYRTEVICGLGIVLGCKKDEEAIDCLEGIGDKLGVEVEEVWRCYCMIMEVSKALEPLGSAFQILGSIPRIERSEMEKMLNKR